MSYNWYASAAYLCSMKSMRMTIHWACLLSLLAACTTPLREGAKPTDSLVPYASILPQLTSNTRKILVMVEQSVTSGDEGLGHVLRNCQRGILAVVEQGDWFFYPSSAVSDQTTLAPTMFMDGYAIKRGGREIIQWSNW